MQIDEMAKRLSEPKKTSQERAQKESDLAAQRKGTYMLQETTTTTLTLIVLAKGHQSVGCCHNIHTRNR